jgi:hypothetical protein
MCVNAHNASSACSLFCGSRVVRTASQRRSQTVGGVAHGSPAAHTLMCCRGLSVGRCEPVGRQRQRGPFIRYRQTTAPDHERLTNTTRIGVGHVRANATYDRYEHSDANTNQATRCSNNLDCENVQSIWQDQFWSQVDRRNRTHSFRSRDIGMDAGVQT